MSDYEDQIPKCPKCNTELKGWTEPSEESCTFKEFVICAVIVFVIVTNSIAAVGGVLNGGGDDPVHDCGRWFSKRWNYVFPAYQVTCRTTYWLRNKEEIKDDINGSR